MTRVDELLAALHEHNESAEGFGHSLRLDFSRLVVESLNRLGWTQRQLARSCGLRDSYVSRIVHGEANFTLDTVGSILHALGVRPSLVGTPISTPSGTSLPLQTTSTLETTHGEVIATYKASVTTVPDRPEFTIIATSNAERAERPDSQQHVRQSSTGGVGGLDATLASTGHSSGVPGVRLRHSRSRRVDGSLQTQHHS